MEVKKQRRRAIIWGLISFPLAVCLLLSLLSYWTPTHFAPWLPFWGLAFPFWFLSLGILSLIGFWIHRRGAVVVTLVWLLGFPCATDYLSFHGPEETPPQGAIKVLSWNVNLFGFNFPQKRKMRLDMLQEVQNQHPDIVY
jgi:peptidoglycan/LPS O-acetylase OafA/YrhL